MTGYVATAETEISASPAQVWEVLTDPEQIKKFMFGADVKTDWQPGSSIVWQGVYEGKEYEDKGEIIEVDPGRLLKVTHYSPLTGQPDVPENYHTLTYELEDRGTSTHLSLSQDNNASEEEAEHSRGMWEMLVSGVKEAAERG
ncbi:SRPBCC domain-containing protein [Kribbella sp. NPDC006257]|uniref:SRPBCC domain-containing protein n=1 Tax=Kribbella sp. NPDC006257 TaxID=3156738 RepID=UPI0033BE9CB9